MIRAGVLIIVTGVATNVFSAILTTSSVLGNKVPGEQDLPPVPGKQDLLTVGEGVVGNGGAVDGDGRGRATPRSCNVISVAQPVSTFSVIVADSTVTDFATPSSTTRPRVDRVSSSVCHSFATAATCFR